MIFFHGISCGFYIDSVHGPRTILVPDPYWIRPTLSIPDPAWSPSDDPEAEAPVIEVLDSSAVAPQVEIANPACSLPPEDELVEVAEDYYLELLGGQGQGSLIQANAEGYPVLVEPPPLDAIELGSRERTWRDRALERVQWLRDRHRDEVELEIATTLTMAQFKDVLTYMQALRDWPQDERFPEAAYRPAAPDSIQHLLA